MCMLVCMQSYVITKMSNYLDLPYQQLSLLFFRLLFFSFSIDSHWLVFGKLRFQPITKSFLICSCADSASVPSKEDIRVIIVLLNIPVLASFSCVPVSLAGLQKLFRDAWIRFLRNAVGR